MSSNSYPREHRLLSESQFQPIFKAPDYRAGGDHLLLLAKENLLNIPRLGLVVGKRRVRRANKRNLIKRQCRESFRLRQQQLQGLDVIMLVKRDLHCPKPDQVRAELEKLWDKLLAKRSQD